MKPICVLLILSYCVLLTYGANILVIVHIPAPSHFRCFNPLVEALAQRGHNVTFATFIKPAENENITFLDLRDAIPYFPASFAVFRSQTRFKNMLHMYTISKRFVEGTFLTETLQRLIHDNETTFDVVLTEIYFSHGPIIFAKKFNAPAIGLVPQALPPCYSWSISSPLETSYIPNMYLPYTDEMSFLQRVTNAFFTVAHILGYEFENAPDNQLAVDRNFPHMQPSERDLKNVFDNLALILANTHYSVGYPRPLSPKVIEVAGVHLKQTKPLPSNIQKYIDESEHGVVYVSFGSMIDPSYIENWSNAIIEVFEKLPVRVLWKWKTSLLKRNVSNNFLIQDWFPQNDILNHPNCKLFISHGGVHSLIETVNAGVPIIGVPFFSDQPYNVALIKKLGIGLGLPDVEKDSLRDSVTEILQNPKYRENVKLRSQLFRDRIADPISTSVYWIEHVIRYKGTPHLNLGAMKLTWYQYYMLDVAAFIIFLVAVFFTSVTLSIRFIINFIKLKVYKLLFSKCKSVNLDKRKKVE